MVSPVRFWPSAPPPSLPIPGQYARQPAFGDSSAGSKQGRLAPLMAAPGRRRGTRVATDITGKAAPAAERKPERGRHSWPRAGIRPSRGGHCSERARLRPSQPGGMPGACPFRLRPDAAQHAQHRVVRRSPRGNPVAAMRHAVASGDSVLSGEILERAGDGASARRPRAGCRSVRGTEPITPGP